MESIRSTPSRAAAVGWRDVTTGVCARGGDGQGPAPARRGVRYGAQKARWSMLLNPPPGEGRLRRHDGRHAWGLRRRQFLVAPQPWAAAGRRAPPSSPPVAERRGGSVRAPGGGLPLLEEVLARCAMAGADALALARVAAPEPAKAPVGAVAAATGCGGGGPHEPRARPRGMRRRRTPRTVSWRKHDVGECAVVAVANRRWTV